MILLHTMSSGKGEQRHWTDLVGGPNMRLKHLIWQSRCSLFLEQDVRCILITEEWPKLLAVCHQSSWIVYEHVPKHRKSHGCSESGKPCKTGRPIVFQMVLGSGKSHSMPYGLMIVILNQLECLPIHVGRSLFGRNPTGNPRVTRGQSEDPTPKVESFCALQNPMAWPVHCWVFLVSDSLSIKSCLFKMIPFD